MNVKQAVVLAIGTMAAIALVMTPRGHTPLRQVSARQSDREIVKTYQSHSSYLQPTLFAAVVLVTGTCVFTLRRKG